MKEPRQLKSSDVKKLRDYLLRKQKGKCLICRKHIERPCLDHHHKKRVKGTGLIRGVLCSNCNVFLAKSENNSVRYAIARKDLPFVLRKMADYLERKQIPLIHPSEAPKSLKLTKASYNKLKKVYVGKAAFPVYREPTKNKPIQTLTKPLERLFIEYGIKPEFYK